MNANSKCGRTYFSLFLLFDVITTLHSIEPFNIPSQLPCRVNMTSTCPNYEITKWNQKNIGNKLKEWVRSIAIKWKYNEFLTSGNHCKVFTKLENDVFEKYAPGAYDPYIIMIGKDASNFAKSKDEKIRSIENTTKPKLHGPTWADLNNGYEWIINQTPEEISIRLSDDAILGNGLYYGLLSGDHMKLEGDVTFIYPDMKTALTGKFKNGVMVEGSPAKIVAERCNDGLKEIRISTPKVNSPKFRFQRNTRIRVHRPRIMDPFEKNTVYVNETATSGDGLFARRDIEANEIVSYYSGTIWRREEANQDEGPGYGANQTGIERYSHGRNSVRHPSPEFNIDVPSEYWEISNYRATLGHKANHSFLKSNARYVSVIHPRHGPIIAVVSERKIKKGEEILCSYGYLIDSVIPSWYAYSYYDEFKEYWPGKYVYDELSDNVECFYEID